jgi:hypothetical protein
VLGVMNFRPIVNNVQPMKLETGIVSR